jgi:FMN phosphatase YigB (HAD superfamily)
LPPNLHGRPGSRRLTSIHQYGRRWLCWNVVLNEHPREVELLALSSFLMDYPFAERLYPNALEVLERLRSLGPTVLLSDGDIVFQPRKLEHAGLAKVVDGDALIYIHKEEALDDVERRFRAEHYVLVDDKLRILDAVKQVWARA